MHDLSENERFIKLPFEIQRATANNMNSRLQITPHFVKLRRWMIPTKPTPLFEYIWIKQSNLIQPKFNAKQTNQLIEYSWV